jgi:peptide/nickel transport system ATP-binding protein
MIFISHDLSTAAELADRVATMYAGKIVELGSVLDTFYKPAHPYTLGLIQAVPTVTGDFEELSSIPGAPPDLVNPPPGCKFHPRCTYATDICYEEEPERIPIPENPEHSVACHHYEEALRDATEMWERHTDRVGETS